MSVKAILKEFWKTVEDYDGDISCCKIGSRDGVDYYRIITDGNTFEAAARKEDNSVVFYRGDGVSEWRSTDLAPVIELDGKPYLADQLVRPINSPSFLAKEAGVSVATVYKHAKRLGRLPTLEELKNTKTGRPRKY